MVKIGHNYDKMPTLALKDIESTIECAIIRFQVDSNDKESLQQEDYDKYTRLLDRRDEVRAELKKREQ
uniref:hypothetical protein n=1 Tax=Lachnospira sp. TaxID=2049031 RepID=UPI003FF0CAA9